MIALPKKLLFLSGTALVTMSWMLTLMSMVDYNGDTTRIKEAANDITKANKASEHKLKSFVTHNRNQMHSSFPTTVDPRSQYTDPLESFHSTRELPSPLRVMKTYQEWHSVSALKENPSHRKFSVAFYSCPAQAGTQLHYFFNGTQKTFK